MAPGPLTTASRGGFGFGLQHRGGNYGRVFSAPSAGSTYGPQPGAQHQRFYLDGQSHGVLEAGDKLTVTVDNEGNTTVSATGPDNGAVEEVEEAAEADNGANGTNGEEEEESKSRASPFGRRDKMGTAPPSSRLLVIRQFPGSEKIDAR